MIKDNSIMTVSQVVTDRLRRDILDGRYGPGDRITVNQIAQEYGVSHTPVREAFQSLKGERLVEILQYKGAVVKQMDIKTVSDIYDVRCAVEVVIMSNIYKNGISPEMIRQLTSINNTMDFSRPLSEITQNFSLINDLFHHTLFSACDNQQAVEMYILHSNLFQALKKRYPVGIDRIRVSHAEHYQMLDILRDGTLEELRNITIQHNEGAKDNFLRQMRIVASNAEKQP